MTERPILMSAPMVRAILEGRKTQTRRVVKPQPDSLSTDGVPTRFFHKRAIGSGYQVQISCPYGVPGDRLWVRETHWMDRRDPTMVAMDLDGYVVARSGYETGQACDVTQLSRHEFWRKRPGIHMPRWASRILLEVTAVRVERLQHISVADCIAEGIPRGGPENPDGIERKEYRALWEQINGPGSWDANPWVWVVEFRRVEA